MISIICVYNNEKILNKFLLNSITQQKFTDYELILLNNYDSHYRSAVEALSDGVAKAKGDIYLFVHQDVYFLDNDAFEKIEQFCKSFNFGVAGAAGVDFDKRLRCAVVQGIDKANAGEEVDELTEVQTLDECMFFVKKENFKGFEYIDDSWHLYAVSYSISCMLDDFKNYVLPIHIWHYSPGLSFDKSYFKTLKRYFKKHSDIKEVSCTMGCFKNNMLFPLYCFYKTMKIFVSKKLKLGIWEQSNSKKK